MILSMHHAQIGIPKDSEARAREFYCDFLGLSEIGKPDSLRGNGGFWLELGEVQIHAGVEDGVDRSATRAHLAYLVSDLAQWKQKLAARGVETKNGAPIPGYDRFEFRDPFGNRIEFLQKL